MTSKKEKLIHDLIDVTLLESNLKHGFNFNSSHEGWAVTLEEIEEFQEAFDEIINYFSDTIWVDIRNDSNNSKLKTEYSKLYNMCLNAFLEFLQLTAMMKKNLKFYEKEITK